MNDRQRMALDFLNQNCKFTPYGVPWSDKAESWVAELYGVIGKGKTKGEAADSLGVKLFNAREICELAGALSTASCLEYFDVVPVPKSVQMIQEKIDELWSFNRGITYIFLSSKFADRLTKDGVNYMNLGNMLKFPHRLPVKVEVMTKMKHADFYLV